MELKSCPSISSRQAELDGWALTGRAAEGLAFMLLIDNLPEAGGLWGPCFKNRAKFFAVLNF
jgi:hypothetical protein